MRTPKAVQQWEAVKAQVYELSEVTRKRSRKYRVGYFMSVTLNLKAFGFAKVGKKQLQERRDNAFKFGHSNTEHFTITFSGPREPQQGCLARVQEYFLPFRQMLLKAGIPFVDLHQPDYDNDRICQHLLVVAPEAVQKWYRKNGGGLL